MRLLKSIKEYVNTQVDHGCLVLHFMKIRQLIINLKKKIFTLIFLEIKFLYNQRITHTYHLDIHTKI